MCLLIIIIIINILHLLWLTILQTYSLTSSCSNLLKC